MKVGVVGKGGVGKTTTAALLARACAERARRVLAVDTDSNPNLGLSLGLTTEETEAVPTLPRSVLFGPGGDVDADELIDEYGRATPSGVTLLSALRISEAGGGCTCSGHATVRSLLGEALAQRADVTIVDMEAGLEHLSRSGGTLAHADLLVMVCEPSRKSVLTAARTATLAEELGLERVVVVGNKVRDEEDADFLRSACADAGLTLLALLPHDSAVAEADRGGEGELPPIPEELTPALDALVEGLEASGSKAARA